MVYPIARNLVAPFFRLWIRKISGLKNLKKAQSFIFVSNHGSFADDFILPFLIMAYTNKYIHIYCNDRYYKNFIIRRYLEWGKCIPIRVGEKSEEAKRVKDNAFNLALKYLKNNEPVGIFPEGHRSVNGKLMKARSGAARLAVTAKVPVIPIGTIGTYEMLPKGAKFPKLKRCEINIGEPIYLDKYFGKESNKKALKEATTLIMKEIAKLAKQEYNY